ncbi:hypothetical protein GLAREA_03331 [Glarea lozoyensis ATCC 20868]|uniref:Heterokaryon incompatibility domain-containing protein n=1 Tax=Glarea lozoyensis (strain ATCC 20868 / MF5171) TaxID=1116229 RepID=S3CZP3_GLAL2|nr:uncharacterized protein GLAREA_03331 [Glarea lozoyensis ATCC 20868]EPE30364.1 hypothetical protein GLAREA_03331 [Glarea lozoyensis ATCC 20868]
MSVTPSNSVPNDHNDDKTAPHTCEYCHKIILDPGHDDLTYKPATESRKIGSVDFAQVIIGANNGCRLFSLIMTLSKLGMKKTFEGTKYGRLRTEFAKCPCNFVLYWWFPPENAPIQFGALKKWPAIVEYTSAMDEHFQIVFGQSHLTKDYPASQRSLYDLRYEIECCVSRHKQCNIRSVLDSMPRRLLKITPIGDEYLVTLQMTEGRQQEKYVALSYCWGGVQRFCLKTSNVEAFTDSINFRQLPATIQDAVVATHHFGLQLLWVDALCIIQDDPEDKAAEISRMGAIYSLAYVTIVASRSRSAQEGFLFPRLNSDVVCSEIEFLEVSLRSLTPEGNIGHIVLTLCRRGRSDDEPLDRRGWTLQELLLSPRVVRITQTQSLFICCEETTDHQLDQKDMNMGEPKHTREITRCNYYYDGLFDRGDYSIKYNLGVAEKLNPILRPNLENMGLDWDIIARDISPVCGSMSTIDHWNKLVEAFTKRSLSNPSDRLLALSAIAQHFGKVFQDNYVAGMWGFSLLLQLLWTPHLETNAANALTARPSVYTGPSWSWASLTVGVDFPNLDRLQNVYASDPYAVRLKILDCRTQLKTQCYPYGAVTSGCLKVFGRRRQIKWYESFQHTKDVDRRPGLSYDITKSKSFKQFRRGRVELDCIEDNLWDPVGSYPSVSLLEVLNDVAAERAICGLVIRRIANSDCFRRIGVFFLYSRLPRREIREEPKIELQEDWKRTDPAKYRKIRAQNEAIRVKYRAYLRSRMTWFDRCKREIITIE